MRKIQNSHQHKYKSYLKSLVIIFLSLGVAVIWINYFKFPPGWDFRNNLYLPVNLLIQHQSPYNIHILVDGSNAVWLPMVMGIFLPLGYLNLQQANNFWWLLNIAAFITLLFITIEQKPPPLPKLILTVLLIFLFPSTASHLFLGQISALICLAFVIIIWFGERVPVWILGFFFAFTLTKPQLAIVFIPTYFYIVQRERGWREFGKLSLWTLIGTVVLCLPVTLIQPDWYKDFISNLKRNPTWAHPSIYGLFFSPLGLSGVIMGWIYIGIGIGVAFYGVTRFGNKEGLLWALAMTPVFSPYIWSWDFIFLYPLMIYSLYQQKNSFKSTLLFGSYFMVGAGFLVLKFTGQLDDSLNWWVPWSLIAVSLLVKLLPEKRNNA